MSDDELDRRIMQRWNALGEKMARELTRIENRAVTSGEMARILREMLTVSRQAE